MTAGAYYIIRRRRAFTLVELALVIAILSVLMAVAAPRYAIALDGYRAEHAARRIASDIGTAQATARAAGASQAIVFNAGTNSYTLSGAVAGNNPARVTLGDAPFNAVLESASFGGDGTLTFNGFALPRSAGTVVVRSGQVRRTILVASITGVVTIQ